MIQKRKKKVWKEIIQFIKLQLAGNILFWGTYLGYAVGHELLDWNSTYSMVTGSLIAHVIFFIVDKNWVFNTGAGRRKTSGELMRFIIFMTLNFFINLGIVKGLEIYFGITPYIGQFVAGGFFAVWSYLGLKFWVFRSGRHAQHYALTLETKKLKEKRSAGAKHIEAQQKTKRVARVY